MSLRAVVFTAASLGCIAPAWAKPPTYTKKASAVINQINGQLSSTTDAEAVFSYDAPDKPSWSHRCVRADVKVSPGNGREGGEVVTKGACGPGMDGKWPLSSTVQVPLSAKNAARQLCASKPKDETSRHQSSFPASVEIRYCYLNMNATREGSTRTWKTDCGSSKDTITTNHTLQVPFEVVCRAMPAKKATVETKPDLQKPPRPKVDVTPKPNTPTLQRGDRSKLGK